MGVTIFVFGSNRLGIHGAGAALFAKENYGAEQGVGVGPTGHAYAIPTKNTPWKSMELREIEPYVAEFKRYAADHPDDTFALTAIGCGLAGFKPSQIAPMFAGSPANVQMPIEFGGFLVLGGLETADIVTRDDGTQGPSIEHKFWMQP